MMEKTMKAVIWNGKPWFEGLSYGDFPVPEHGGDWVLVRNNVCGVCGSDLHFFSGAQDGRFPAKNLPAVFGHENAATVVAADSATGFKPGDRVAVEAIHSCLNFGKTCPRCMSGQFHMCDEGMTHIGLPYVRMLPGGYGVIKQYCEYLALGVCDIINIFAPEMILIGGGVSRQGARILDPVSRYVRENCFDKREEAMPVIKAASMGNDAGIIGAAALYSTAGTRA